MNKFNVFQDNDPMIRWNVVEAMDPVYYRPYLSPKTGKITIVCMQSFDEWDYTAGNFVINQKFDTEKEAQE